MVFKSSKFLVLSFVVLIYLVEIGINSSTTIVCNSKKLTSIFFEGMDCDNNTS
jgi:hypothetical protein